MRFRISSTVFLMLISSFAFCNEARAETDCGQILEHGIFNTSSTDSLSIRTHTFINWLSQSTFQSWGEAKDTAAKLGFAIEGVPLEIGGHSRESDWHNYQSSLQSLNFSDEKTLESFSQVVNAADQGIVDAWKACILSKRAVSHAFIELSYDPTVFTINLVYDPVGPPFTATISDFDIQPGTVECAPTIHTWRPFRSEITSGGLILNCKRKSAADAVQVTGNTLKGALSAKLPGLTPMSGSPNSVIIDLPLVVDAENIPIDFKTPDGNHYSGCACDPDDRVKFPDSIYNVKANTEFNFRYQAGQRYHGQGFDRFQGHVNWGPSWTTLHDFQAWSYLGIAGTLKVKFSKPGDYNVVVDMVADILDGFYGCRNTCTASGTVQVHVKK